MINSTTEAIASDYRAGLPAERKEKEMATKTMTPEHKKALAEGRAQGRAVRKYLESLDAHHSRGGRRTPDAVISRLEKIEEEIGCENPLKRLELAQERLELQTWLEAQKSEKTDTQDLEQAFIEAAKPYSDRKGITYQAWRELGVKPAVLKAAGISR